MQTTYRILNLEESGFCPSGRFDLDVLDGLTSKPKELPSKYLYDAIGSHLFENIMKLEEYYPTGCELEILTRCKRDLQQMTGKSPFRLVELGVGDAKKTRILLRHLVDEGHEFEYVPIDCCQEMVEEVVSTLQKEFRFSPLSVLGIIADYTTALQWLSKENGVRNIVLFLGSSIGNFDPKQAQQFLHQIWNALSDGDSVFIGFDLKKDIAMLERAYDDSRGITREFNLNLLDRMNRELDADFNRDQFFHHSYYNPCEGRMESWLVSKITQTVTIGRLQKSFDFQPWEGIHVENSYKYSIKDIEELADAMGFVICDELLDSKGYFVDAIWQVKKIQAPIMEMKQ